MKIKVINFEKTFALDIKTAEQEDLPIRYIHTSDDEESKRVSLSLIREGNCDVLFVIFEYPDIGGYSSGFSPDNEKYKDACIRADTAAAELIYAAKKSDGHDTHRLTVITTDHGGVGRRHGGQSVHERATWAVINRS